jgi:hypothetical protein
MTRIDDDPWKDQRMGLFSAPRRRTGHPRTPGARWLSDSSDELYFWRRSRNQHRVDVMRANPATGSVEVVIEERLNTYVEHQTPRRLANGDLIWWSERDGWAHLYRIAPDGSVVARLTEGPWHVSGVAEVDEEQGYVYLRGNAREAGRGSLLPASLPGAAERAGAGAPEPRRLRPPGEPVTHDPLLREQLSRVNTVPSHHAPRRRGPEDHGAGGGGLLLSSWPPGTSFPSRST